MASAAWAGSGPIAELPADERAARRGARLRELHEASLRLAAPLPAEPDAVAALLSEIVERAVAAVGGRDGRLVLAEDRAWRKLVPDSGPAAGEQGLIRVGRPRLPRPPGPPGQPSQERRRDHQDQQGSYLFRVRWKPDPATLHVLATGEAASVPDTLAASRFGWYPQVAERGIRSFVLVPLQAGGHILGVLTVSFGRPAALTAEDQEILALFAGHAAAALERVRLLYAERRRANQMEQLAATLARVDGAPNEEQALEALLRGAIELLDGDDGVAQLFGAKLGERRLMLRLERGGAPAARSTTPLLPPGSISAAIQAGGPARIVEDFRALDPSAYPLYETMRRRGIRSAVNVPIVAGGKPVGSLHVNHRAARFFDSADLAIAEALATQACAAIERFRLEAAREAALLQLAQQREELVMREAEAAALQRMDALKSELLVTISHELRTPLTVIHAYAQRLQERASALDAAAVATTGARIETSSAQLGRLLEQLLDFTGLERGEVALQLEHFDLVPVLHELLVALRLRPGGDRLVWRLPARLPVHADRARLTQVVANLIDNAAKYAPTGPIEVRGRSVRRPANGACRQERWVRLEVGDQGPGIPPEQQQRIWEKFVRGDLGTQFHPVQGSGIGLAVVKALVEAQGGRVGLDSAPGRGSRFWFELPAQTAKQAPKHTRAA
ncbi:MAG: GAF domain-containing protein [Chloroflexi bacterium]|nr:GAF domain-containing protein [Chloroflexota bacterium]